MADLAVVAFCVLSRVRDPASAKQGWLTRCTAQHESVYIGDFLKSRRKAVAKAKEWLEAHRPAPKLVVSVEELRNGR